MCAKYVSEAGDAFVGAKTMDDNLFPRPHFLLPSASGYPGSRWNILLQFIHSTTISNTWKNKIKELKSSHVNLKVFRRLSRVQMEHIIAIYT